MGSEQWSIRPYQPNDEAAIENITFKTGFKGEGLEGRDYFNDKKLFYLIFIAYYARNEPEHFFVAVDLSTGKPASAGLQIESVAQSEDRPELSVVGFICGSPDTVLQQKRFTHTMIWRIALRTFLFTSWRYPKTIKTLIGLGKVLADIRIHPELTDKINARYPAHLHINVLPEYHHKGIGSHLLGHYEEHLINLGIEGVHLETSSRNHKAVPFYTKHGYTVVKEVPIKSHPIFDKLSFLTFAKKLTTDH